jgi:peptidyl-prolyl cis-trans isomerase D
MALIGKLRERSGLIIGAIAVSILGFLIMDATNSQSGVLMGRDTNVGKVNGEALDYNEFMTLYEENLKNAELQMRNQGGSMTDEQRDMIRQQTWDDFVTKTVTTESFDKIGLGVSDDELVEITMGQNPHPYIKQSFTNPQTGQFDAQQVKLFLQNLDQDEKGTEPGTRRKQWNSFEKEIKKNQLTQKYTALVSKGLNTPSWQAQMLYQDVNRKASFKYLLLPYADITENQIKYTDDDLKKYLESNKIRFEQKEESRKLLYAAFDIAPSSSDTALTLSQLNEKLEDFKTAENTSADSLFVRIYSEDGFNPVYAKSQDLIGSPIVDDLFSQPVKTVIGPYIEEGKFKYAKVSGRKLLSDSVRVREIVFSFDNITTQEQGQAKRKLFDSIFIEIDSLKKDFGMMAAMFSDDQNARPRGGDIGWVKFGTTEPNYNNTIFFDLEKGGYAKTATQNSLRIVQVIDDRPSTPGVKVAYYSKSILPSPETEKSIYAAASKFASDHSSDAKFKAAAKSNSQIKTVESIRKEETTVQGIGNSRDIVRWVYNAKKGDVSGILSADRKHVVCLLEAIRSKGLPELDAVKDQVKIAFLKDKRSEMLKQKIAASQATTIDALAAKLGKEVGLAEEASAANPVLGTTGYEPAIVTAGVYAKQGKLSAPIEGNGGVYVLEKVSGIVPPPATDVTMYKGQLSNAANGKATRSAVEALKKLAKIEDNRFDFF